MTKDSTSTLFATSRATGRESIWPPTRETFAHLFCPFDHDASDLLPKIDTPTLIVAGDRDPLNPRRARRGTW